MNKLARTARTLTGALGTARAQTTTRTEGQARPNVLFLATTGRPGAVDVDGTRVNVGVLSADPPSPLFLTPGTHDITVKTSLRGEVLATATLNVLPNTLYAASPQNDDTRDANVTGSVLSLASGSTAVWGR